MNCNQYSYPQSNMNTQKTSQTQSRDLTTRPMQPGMANMDMGKSMGMQGMNMPSMGSGTSMPGVSQTTMPGGGWNLPSTAAASPLAAQTPTTVESPYYTAGFLRNFIGKNMRVEFLIGTSGALVDRTGILMEVGASYIVLRPSFTDDLLMCDLYAIKFVMIYG